MSSMMLSAAARPNELMFLDPKAAEVIRSKVDRLALRFSVDIEVEPSTEASNPGAWITISGSLARVNNAKAHIKALVNPEEAVELRIPYKHFSDLTDPASKQRLERETRAIVEYTEEMDNTESFKATIKGARPAVSMAMTFLKEKAETVQDRGDDRPSLFPAPMSPTSSFELDQRLLGLTDKFNIDSNNLANIPDVVKRLMVSWDKEEKEGKSSEDGSSEPDSDEAEEENSDSHDGQSDMETDDSLDDTPPTQVPRSALHQPQPSRPTAPRTGLQKLLAPKSNPPSMEGRMKSPREALNHKVSDLAAASRLKTQPSEPPSLHSRLVKVRGVADEYSHLSDKHYKGASLFGGISNKDRMEASSSNRGLTVDLTTSPARQPVHKSTIYTLSSDEEESPASRKPFQPYDSPHQVAVKREIKPPAPQTISRGSNAGYVTVDSDNSSGSTSDDSDLRVMSPRASRRTESPKAAASLWTEEEREIHEHEIHWFGNRARKQGYDELIVAMVNSQFDNEKVVTDDMYMKALNAEVAETKRVKNTPPSLFQSQPPSHATAARTDVRLKTNQIAYPHSNQPDISRVADGMGTSVQVRSNIVPVPPYRQVIPHAVTSQLQYPTSSSNSAYGSQPQPLIQYPTAMVPSSVKIGMGVNSIKPNQQAQPLWRELPRELPQASSMDFSESGMPSMKSASDKSHRQVILDGSNIAMYHGKHKRFSIRGIATAIKTLEQHYHVPSSKITCVIPQKSRSDIRHSGERESRLLQELDDQDYITISPSKRVGNRVINPYDDRLILDLALQTNGVVISNDRYLDFLDDRRYRDLVQNRVIMFTFFKDIFHVNEEPMGRSGPTLNQLLASEQVPNARHPAMERLGPYTLPHVNTLPHHQPIRELDQDRRTTARTAMIKRQMSEVFPDNATSIQSTLDKYPDIHDASVLTEIMLAASGD